MPKPYSQDLRDRVIDAVKKGGMSRRAAARRYEISVSVAIKWLERVERHGSREPVGHGGHRASKLMPHLDFLEAARSEKSDITLQALCDRLWSERGVKAEQHLDDEPLLFSPDRDHAQKKTLVAREQDRPDISRHRKRWRAYQGLIGSSAFWSSSTRPGQRPRRDLDKDQDETWTKTKTRPGQRPT